MKKRNYKNRNIHALIAFLISFVLFTGCSSSHEHTWDEGTITVTPTCITEGEIVYTCTECNETKKETLPVSEEHNWVTDGTITYRCKSCEATFTSVGDLINHYGNVHGTSGVVWKTQDYVCQDCGEVQTLDIDDNGCTAAGGDC